MRAVVSLALIGAANAFTHGAHRSLRAAPLRAATLPGPLAEAPDVGMLPDCPPTIWNSGFDDVVGERDGGGELLECPLEISATDYFGPSEGPNKDAASITAKKDEVLAVARHRPPPPLPPLPPPLLPPPPPPPPVS
mmetsp:Transcript_26322/g.61740  ORF Transcript_26322/g.61740 Transcript_26322/m.61740 type:complete len:136 (-) Transcript_26322:1321-1728(-)